MYTFLYKKKINFLSNSFVFLICKMYTLDQYFWLEMAQKQNSWFLIVFIN